MTKLTAREVAEQLGLTVRRVNGLIISGRLPSERFGQARIFDEEDLPLVEDRKPRRPSKKEAAKVLQVEKKRCSKNEGRSKN